MRAVLCNKSRASSGSSMVVPCHQFCLWFSRTKSVGPADKWNVSSLEISGLHLRYLLIIILLALSDCDLPDTWAVCWLWSSWRENLHLQVWGYDTLPDDGERPPSGWESVAAPSKDGSISESCSQTRVRWTIIPTDILVQRQLWCRPCTRLLVRMNLKVKF